MGLGPRPRPALNKRPSGQDMTQSIPTSTRGLNARDSISEMPPNMALQLQNIFPNPSDIQVRACDKQFWNNIYNAATPIYTLMEYRPASGTRKLFGTCGTNLYDFTNPPGNPSQFNYHGVGAVQIGSVTLTGSEPTGYAGATTYTANITIDGGAPQAISVLGSNATTISQLISQLNAQLVGATASLMSTFTLSAKFYIVILSSSTGASSNVTITDTGANHLFSSITNFVAILDHNANPGRVDGTAASVTGLTAGTQWQWVNMANSTVSVLFAANGADNMQRYDASNGWKDVSTAGAWQITGITANTVNNMALIHHRLFFSVNNSAIVYYLGADALAGAVTALDLGGIFDKGGAVVAIGGWTSADSGTGTQEYTVFVTDKGQAAVYQGYDPTNQALWQLAAVYNIGAPIGKRCLLKYSNDLLLLTTDGLVPASKAFVSDRTNERIALTTNIQDIVASDINTYGATTLGWGMTFWPEAQHLLINVPTGDTTGQQLAMNTIHQAWAVYTGWSANDMLAARPGTGITGRDVLVYCDTLGNITYVDPNDFTNTASLNIGKDVYNGLCTIVWQPAFNYLSGGRFRTKSVEMIRPNMVYNSASSISMVAGVDYDFVVQTPTGAVLLPNVAGGSGGGAVSKTGPNLGSTPVFRMVWLNGSAVGVAFAPHFQLTCQTSLHFDAIDVVFRLGGIQSS